jgi:hypothetical protein
LSDTNKLEEQVREMAMLTVLSNKINPIQEKNLKMYPLVYFNGVKSVKIEYDLTHKKTTDDEPVINNSVVSYYLEIDEKQENNSLEVRFQHLENSVRNLFWKDVSVEVFFNDRIVFKSKKNG